MNFQEIEAFQNRLKVYNFKYDEDFLRDVIANYDFEKVMDAYKNIVKNSQRLNGLNIIAELQEELRNIAPITPQIKFYAPKCKICDNSGLVSFEGSNGYNYAVACKCESGKQKSNFNKKLAIWDGNITQIIRGELMSLDFAYRYKIEI